MLKSYPQIVVKRLTTNTLQQKPCKPPGRGGALNRSMPRVPGLAYKTVDLPARM